MKNLALIFTAAITSVISLDCFAQPSEELPSDYASNDLAIVSYHVEERINMPLGGSVTTYNVSSLELVNTTDLGHNNTRIVTPKYGRPKMKTIEIGNEHPEIKVAIAAPAPEPIKVSKIIAEEKPKGERPKFVNIDIIDTYERVLEKGYQSVDMLKRVANNRYFKDDLAIAAKWYSQLFAMTTDLDAEYYFRYAKSLMAINETKKADEMMAIFNSKSKK